MSSRLEFTFVGLALALLVRINKHWGIRAVAVTNPTPQSGRDSAITHEVIGLELPGRNLEYSKMIVDAWLDNPFGFHRQRKF